MNMTEGIRQFTPREIVSELDRYIIGQKDAKRAVAIAMRNRWRRQNVASELRDEISPKNIILIGPTGVGKTEIARRLSKLANAPFVKVEASKFTEVGYVGKDVESMIRELTEIAVGMVRQEEEAKVQARAAENAEERILDLLIPKKSKPAKTNVDPEDSFADMSLLESEETEDSSREKMRQMLREGKLNNRSVELEPSASKSPMGMGGGIPMIEVVSTGSSLDEIGKNLRDMMSNFMPKGRKRSKLKVPQALEALQAEEAQKLLDMDEISRLAIERAEQSGIIFIDEIDKIASREKGGGGHGPDVSREGVQRDILPIIEGSRVHTKYGYVRTDFMLFVAAGAFHVSKPSDLIPELQGRFPIRVELKSLTEEDFYKILTEPTNSLVRQYHAMLETEKVTLEFKEDALREMARYAAVANAQMENIGARRLHTIMELVLDDLLFSASEKTGTSMLIDSVYVKTRMEGVIKDQDLSRYIL